MEKKNDLEYKLDDPEEEVIQNKFSGKNNTNKNKIIISAIIISIVIIIGIIIIIFVWIKPSKKKNDTKISEYYIYKNIPTAENKTIINSFKSDCENYNPILGNINNGNDYEETDRNNFDICIPYNITKRKNRYN